MVGTAITVAVCDDDALARANLVKWLGSVATPPGFSLSVIEASSGDELLRRHRAGERFDILFLDMIMPGSNGVETAAALRESGDGSLIICLTSTPDFAVQSYRIDAFDYLIKANDPSLLESSFNKALKALSVQDSLRLSIRSGTTVHSVPCSDVEYVEAFSKKLSYHLASGEIIESYKSIRELESELSGLPQFFKIHRSIVANLSCLSAIDPRFVMTKSSARLPVARGKYEQLERAFLDYSAKI